MEITQPGIKVQGEGSEPLEIGSRFRVASLKKFTAFAKLLISAGGRTRIISQATQHFDLREELKETFPGESSHGYLLDPCDPG
jgi:hypothetical protein